MKKKKRTNKGRWQMPLKDISCNNSQCCARRSYFVSDDSVSSVTPFLSTQSNQLTKFTLSVRLVNGKRAVSPHDNEYVILILFSTSSSSTLWLCANEVLQLMICTKSKKKNFQYWWPNRAKIVNHLARKIFRKSETHKQEPRERLR